MEPGIQEEIERQVDRRLQEVYRENESSHRLFLETMFKRTTWAIGVLLVLVLGAGSFLFGKSIQAAADAGVNAMLTESVLAKRLRTQVDESIANQQDYVTQRVKKELDSALNETTGRGDIQTAISNKLAEIESLSGEKLLQHSIRIPPGAVTAFDLDSCPSGWEPYQKAAGRFILGVGSGNTDQMGSPLTRRGSNDTGGQEKVKLRIEEMPSHSHQLSTWNGASGNREVGTGHSGADLIPQEWSEAAGGGQSHENMPPFVSLLFCRKLDL